MLMNNSLFDAVHEGHELVHTTVGGDAGVNSNVVHQAEVSPGSVRQTCNNPLNVGKHQAPTMS